MSQEQPEQSQLQQRGLVSFIQQQNPSLEEWQRIMEIAPGPVVLWEAMRRNLLAPAVGQAVVAPTLKPTESSSGPRNELNEDPKAGIEKLPFGDQLQTAYKGYTLMMEDLGIARQKAGVTDELTIASPDTFAIDFRSWASGYEQELGKISESGEVGSFDLVAVPNILINPADVIDLGQSLGTRIGAGADIDERLVRQYDQAELSGTIRDGLQESAVTFVAIAHQTTPALQFVDSMFRTRTIHLEGIPASEQAKALDFARQHYPSVQLPTVMDAISWLYRQGVERRLVPSSELAAQTTTCHYDLPGVSPPSGREKIVPITGLTNEGKVQITAVGVKTTTNKTRLAIPLNQENKPRDFSD